MIYQYNLLNVYLYVSYLCTQYIHNKGKRQPQVSMQDACAQTCARAQACGGLGGSERRAMGSPRLAVGERRPPLLGRVVVRCRLITVWQKRDGAGGGEACPGVRYCFLQLTLCTCS